MLFLIHLLVTTSSRCSHRAFLQWASIQQCLTKSPRRPSGKLSRKSDTGNGFRYATILVRKRVSSSFMYLYLFLNQIRQDIPKRWHNIFWNMESKRKLYFLLYLLPCHIMPKILRKDSQDKNNNIFHSSVTIPYFFLLKS